MCLSNNKTQKQTNSAHHGLLNQTATTLRCFSFIAKSSTILFAKIKVCLSNNKTQKQTNSAHHGLLNQTATTLNLLTKFRIDYITI